MHSLVPSKGLDGEDGARFNDHGLADIEPADFLGDFEAESHFIHVARFDAADPQYSPGRAR